MKAWQITGGFGLDHLKLVQNESPQLSPTQIRCRVKAVALNYRDLLMVQGAYNPRQPLPLTPCSDAVLEVVETGALVRDRQVGERVIPAFAQGWLGGTPTSTALHTTLGGPLPGTLATEVVLEASGVVPCPPHLSDAEASTLACAGVTAWRALTVEAQVKPGQSILTIGTGGVSCFAVQIAHLLGARAIVTSRTPQKLTRIAHLAPDATLCTADTPDWGRAAAKLAGGEGCDVIVELGGAGTLGQSLRAVKPGGTVALIGVLDGVKTELLVTRITMAAIRVQGVLVGSREDLADFCRALSAHPDVRPVVDHIVRFEDAPDAFRALGRAEHVGKIVIEVAP